ncbi:MAG TPA: multicopper oxidase domain-containing protein [Acidiferrobacterales bacterium]
MQRRCNAFISLLSIALLLSSPGVSAATVTLTSLKDNTIYQGIDPLTGENFEDNSCGGGSDFFAGRTNVGFFRRALLTFDIAAAVPPGSTITRVTLRLNANRSGDIQDAVMTLRPLSLDWGEGTANCDPIRGGGQGIPAGPGDATWRAARFQQLLWGNPGGDFGTVSASALVVPRGDALWDSAANPAMAADVQRWLDDPTSNYGWIVVGDEGRDSTTRRFSSREGSAPPVLTVDFDNPNAFACCFADGDCTTVVTTDSCTSQGGAPNTTVRTCSPNPCPQPVGACCNRDESCSNQVERATCEAAGGVFQSASSACSDSRVDCGLEPFVDPLPIPAILQPVRVRADGTPEYEVTLSQQRQALHRDLPVTDVWTYNGVYPGPTIEATVGRPVSVKYINSLPASHYLPVDQCAHGPNYWQNTSRTVVHLHGGHVPARFDGLPEYDIRPGEFDVYEYPNNQLPAPLWYHDHALGITRLNVYMGLAGFYLLRDAFEMGLGLPSGEFEIPAVIQDREFNPDGTLFYPAEIQDGFLGDKILVNGKVWPFLSVKQGKYRFRVLNGSQSRVYRLRLENRLDPTQVIPFYLVGTDGGLIDAPIALNDFVIAPAERMDVVIDFALFPAGTEIVLRNDAPEVPEVPNVMKFIVTAEAGHTAPLPMTLRPVTPIPVSEAAGTRRFRLERVAEPCAGGEWLVRSLDAQGNVIGEHWDDLTEFPILGTTEIWEFENPSTMMHPMHVHLVMFQVLGRTRLSDGTAVPLQPWEINTWKDTVRATPGTRTRVIARFEDYPGRYPQHCHVLDHEDHEMMRQYQTVHDPAACNNNGRCDTNEDCVSCPGDCGQVSGAYCGNGLCEIGDGENFDNCSQDCAGKTKGGGAFKCGLGAGYVDCSDARCTSNGYYCRQTARLRACCGDRLCEGRETQTSCAADCTPACVPQSATESGSQCSDGIDNDCDGLVDGSDTDCQAACVPDTTRERGKKCTDGRDNDCDGLIDAADPGCQ